MLLKRFGAVLWTVGLSFSLLIGQVSALPGQDNRQAGQPLSGSGKSTNTPEEIQAMLPIGTLPSQQAYLKASNTDAGDYFGTEVIISGDTMVVGAGSESSNATGIDGDADNDDAEDSGAVYVFVRTGNDWSQQAYIKASNAEAGDRFGLSAAISGDTLVVGAYKEDSSATGVNGNQADNSATDSGAVYVFVRNGNTWTQQAYLKASNTGAGDGFGESVAISGDTIVVGAWFEDSGARSVNGDQADDSQPMAGAAYVFVRNGTDWSQQAYLKAHNGERSDSFGDSVAIAGDVIVVGASGEDSVDPYYLWGGYDNSTYQNIGAAYVFKRMDTTWEAHSDLKPSEIEYLGRFGTSVAISGETIVVGAPQQNDFAGAAYVFTPIGYYWRQQARLLASNAEEWDDFGYQVAIADDSIVVGAAYESSSATGVNGNMADNSATEAGAAYVFTRRGTIWGQKAYLKASNTEAGDWFGASVAISGDLIAVSATGEASSATGVDVSQTDNSAPRAGAVYVFSIPPGVDSVYRVAPAGQSAPGCGGTWATACDSQYALTSLVDAGDQVWVKAGTYHPTADNSREISFQLIRGVALYGGFAGSETSLAQRNPVANPTILSGDIGVEADASDNSYHVINGSGVDDSAILDGFTVMGGNANGNLNSTGGGMYADSNGGGMYAYGGSPTIRNCVFSYNAARGGGGLFNEGGSATIIDTVFSNNIGDPFSGYGGGLFSYYDSNPTLTRVVFENNSAAQGGGIAAFSASNPVLTDITFEGNAAAHGGGMYSWNSVITYTTSLNRVTFSGNSATEKGGGLYIDGSNLTLTNVTLTGNTSDGTGAGIYLEDDSSYDDYVVKLINVTLNGNSAANTGGAIHVYDVIGEAGLEPLNLQNTIVWGNLSGSGSQVYVASADGKNISISDSIVQDGCPALANCTNLSSSDPLLGALGDYGGFTQTVSLLKGSSAIDTGNDVVCPSSDQRGMARPQGVHCDIGAYEYEIPLLPSPWVGGVSIESDQSVVAVGRPHLGSEVASYIGSTAGSATQYVPMLFKGAFGGTYNAALYLQNVSASAANLSLEFTDSSGTVVYTKADTLDPHASKGYWLPAEVDLPSGFAGGVKVTSDQPILAVGRPHIGAQVMTYNGMSAGALTAWLPMFFKDGFGSYNTALYVQNVTGSSANLTIDYINLDGTVACTDEDTLDANASKGYWSLSIACDSGSLPSGFVGGVKVTSTQDILAVGRAHLGTQITTYNGFDGGADTAYVPMLFRKAFAGGSYNAALYLQNVSGASADMSIEYVDNAGAVAATQNVTLAAGAISSIWLPSVVGLPDGFAGGARIAATQDVIAVGRPHLGAEITAYNGTSAGSLNAYLPMLFKNAYAAPYNAAFYIQNVTGNAANVAISFYDEAGTLSCIKSINLAANATQGFWMPTVSCEP